MLVAIVSVLLARRRIGAFPTAAIIPAPDFNDAATAEVNREGASLILRASLHGDHRSLASCERNTHRASRGGFVSPGRRGERSGAVAGPADVLLHCFRARPGIGILREPGRLFWRC